jgi:IS30 family transposase
VERDLRAGYSPAGISVRLREAGGPTVCPETIYRALYSTSYGGLSLRAHECLRTRRRRRRPRHAPGPARRRRQFGDFKLIDLRPSGAADRSEPGHWEGDLIIGAGHASAIITLVERTSRLTLLGALPHRRTASEVRAGLAVAFAPVPAWMRRSLTWDQGIEMADWSGIEADLDLEVFFCHPHSPWQRPSNEHTNRQLRYWLPRGRDLSHYPQATLDHIATILNTLPRRLLAWRTPQHLYDRLALR